MSFSNDNKRVIEEKQSIHLTFLDSYSAFPVANTATRSCLVHLLDRTDEKYGQLFESIWQGL